MKTYKIFYREFDNKVEAVKQGFSWPGFFFTWIWALVKKMWALGAILFVVVFILNVLSGAIEPVDYYGNINPIGIVLLFCMLGICIFCGIKGNALRENNLLSTGYKLIKMVPAVNPQMAAMAFYEEQKKEKTNA